MSPITAAHLAKLTADKKLAAALLKDHYRWDRK